MTMIDRALLSKLMQRNNEPECDKFTQARLTRIVSNINYEAPVSQVRDILRNEMGFSEEEAYLTYMAAKVLAKDASE